MTLNEWTQKNNPKYLFLRTKDMGDKQFITLIRELKDNPKYKYTCILNDWDGLNGARFLITHEEASKVWIRNDIEDHL